MNTLKTILIAFAAGLILTATSCTSKKENTNEKQVEKSIPIVKTVKVTKDTVVRTITYTASLIPFKEVYLAPAAPGKIEQINVEIGDKVSKGDVIAVMDRSNLESAHINLLNLETNFKRLEELRKTNTVSAQQYDQVKAAYEAAQVSYQFLLDNTQLKAPISGIITGKYFEDKENFTGAPNTKVGKPAIVTIQNIKKLKAVFGISSRYYRLVHKGMIAKITTDIFPGISFPGKVYKVYPIVDPATKTITVEVEVDNGNLKLRPGMFAETQLTLGNNMAILIPTISIIKQKGTNDKYVFINNNGKAKRVLIKTGQVFNDKTEIVSGLKAGDELVIAGQNKLMNDSPLKVIK